MNDRLLKRMILETIQDVLSEKYEHEGEKPQPKDSWNKETGKTAKLTHMGKALKYLYNHKEGVDIDTLKSKFGNDIISRLPKGEYIASQKTNKIRLTRKGISRTEGLLDISHDEDED